MAVLVAVMALRSRRGDAKLPARQCGVGRVNAEGEAVRGAWGGRKARGAPSSPPAVAPVNAFTQVDHRHAAVPRACDRRPCTFIGCSQYVPRTMVQAEARARVLHMVLCLVTARRNSDRTGTQLSRCRYADSPRYYSTDM